MGQPFGENTAEQNDIASIVNAGLVRIILPVAGPATAVIGGRVAMSETGHVFQAAHVVVIAEPTEIKRRGRRVMSRAK
jgi:hypothetical protein